MRSPPWLRTELNIVGKENRNAYFFNLTLILVKGGIHADYLVISAITHNP